MEEAALEGASELFAKGKKASKAKTRAAKEGETVQQMCKHRGTGVVKKVTAALMPVQLRKLVDQHNGRKSRSRRQCGCLGSQIPPLTKAIPCA